MFSNVLGSADISSDGGLQTKERGEIVDIGNTSQSGGWPEKLQDRSIGNSLLPWYIASCMRKRQLWAGNVTRPEGAGHDWSGVDKLSQVVAGQCNLG